jgi:hypothetical protein
MENMPLGNSSLAAICMEKGTLSFDCPISFIVPSRYREWFDATEKSIFLLENYHDLQKQLSNGIGQNF